MCFCSSNLNNLLVGAGSDDLQAITKHKLAKNTRNPKYNSFSVDYDVAVLKLADRFTLGRSIAVISLTAEEPADGEVVMVTGWGALQVITNQKIRLRVLCKTPNNVSKFTSGRVLLSTGWEWLINQTQCCCGEHCQQECLRRRIHRLQPHHVQDDLRRRVRRRQGFVPG